MRRWGTGNKQVRARIEIIPMIDVMMFLLVFFVLISINVIPAFGLKTRLPTASSAETNAGKQNVLIFLGRSGELHLDGIPLPLDELLPRLQAVRRQRADLNIIINGDRSVELQRLIEVMDRLKLAGFQSVALAVQKPRLP